MVIEVGTDLTTITHGEVTNESIELNELLIKELLNVIRNDEKYISRNDIELIEKYKASQQLINDLCTELDVVSLSQIGPYVSEIKKQLEVANAKIKKNNVNFDKKNQYIKKLKTTIETKDVYIAKLKKDNNQKNKQIKKLKKDNNQIKTKLSNYKNRKLIRIVDKLAGK